MVQAEQSGQIPETFWSEKPTGFAEGVEELFLPGVPACLCVGGARQEVSWTRGLRAGSRPAHLYTAYVVPRGLEVEPEIIPS